MNNVNYDPRKFGVDAYGNLYPKSKIRPFYIRRLKKSPQPVGNKKKN